MEFNNFKAPYPPRRATNQNNTRSTFNNGVLSDTYNDFKQVEERYQVLKKICPPVNIPIYVAICWVNYKTIFYSRRMWLRFSVKPSITSTQRFMRKWPNDWMFGLVTAKLQVSVGAAFILSTLVRLYPARLSPIIVRRMRISETSWIM